MLVRIRHLRSLVAILVQIVGEVKVKQISAKLAASGLTVTKTALTSWTVKAIDKATGEEIYVNTKLPQNTSWATEDAALAEIGAILDVESGGYVDFGPDDHRLPFDFGFDHGRLRLRARVLLCNLNRTTVEARFDDDGVPAAHLR